MHTQHTQPVLIKEGSPPFCFLAFSRKITDADQVVWNWSLCMFIIESLSHADLTIYFFFSKLGYNGRIFPNCIATILISVLLLDKLQLRFSFKYQSMQFRFWKCRTLEVIAVWKFLVAFFVTNLSVSADGLLEVAVTSFGPPLTNGRISRLCLCTWRQNEPAYSVLEHCEGKTGIMVF